MAAAAGSSSSGDTSDAETALRKAMEQLMPDVAPEAVDAFARENAGSTYRDLERALENFVRRTIGAAPEIPRATPNGWKVCLRGRYCRLEIVLEIVRMFVVAPFLRVAFPRTSSDKTAYFFDSIL
jgi:hypothetical protein